MGMASSGSSAGFGKLTIDLITDSNRSANYANLQGVTDSFHNLEGLMPTSTVPSRVDLMSLAAQPEQLKRIFGVLRKNIPWSTFRVSSQYLKVMMGTFKDGVFPMADTILQKVDSFLQSKSTDKTREDGEKPGDEQGEDEHEDLTDDDAINVASAEKIKDASQILKDADTLFKLIRSKMAGLLGG